MLMLRRCLSISMCQAHRSLACIGLRIRCVIVRTQGAMSSTFSRFIERSTKIKLRIIVWKVIVPASFRTVAAPAIDFFFSLSPNVIREKIPLISSSNEFDVLSHLNNRHEIKWIHRIERNTEFDQFTHLFAFHFSNSIQIFTNYVYLNKPTRPHSKWTYYREYFRYKLVALIHNFDTVAVLGIYHR